MGRKRGRRRAPFKLKLKKDTLYSIASVCLVVIGGIIIVSFSAQGTLLKAINETFKNSFGFATLVIPFLFISAGLMLTQLKWKIAKPNVFLGAVLTFLSVLGLGQAGNVGREVFLNLASLAHPIGAGLILVGVGFIGFMILTETPLDEIMLGIAAGFKKITSSFSKVKRSTKKPDFITKAPKEITIKGADKPASKPAPSAGKKTPTDEQLPLGSQVVSNVPGVEPTIWKLPDISLLEDKVGGEADRGDVKHNASVIERTLESFGIKARVVEVNLGPAVTQYALEIAIGTKLSKITSLQNDLALALAAPRGQIRIEAPIPGRSLVGIEIPNHSPSFVSLKEVLISEDLKKSKSKLAFGLGLNVSNESVVADITRMPHVLIAGATGSGKSVAINTLIATLLFRASPHEVKFILVDPKRVELTQYNGIPHLLSPVIVEPDKVVSALKWAIAEMERRYKLFSEVGVRNISGYNDFSGFQALPYIVIVIDELADIMLFAPSEVEDAITRLAQMARATGIHLIVATQRPSVDVITGLIKANIPCRISFNVTSMVDSRVIIDTPGAEKLLGQGDMLYIPPEQSRPTRIQGTYVSDEEIKRLIKYLKKSGIEPQYTEEVTTKYKAKKVSSPGDIGGEVDEMFEDAVRLVCEYDKASASLLQRRLSLGYARAARILDQLQQAGIVSPPEGSKPREVLIRNADEFLASHNAEPAE